MKIPDRWLNYTKSTRIKNTPFVACKTPLRDGFSSKLSPEESFTPRHLLLAHPQIKLVIDLTDTTKYYGGVREFKQHGVEYVKIASRGRMIPSDDRFQMFVETVNAFLKSNPNDGLIAVHCTHGVNRTGYFLVRFMIENMGYDSDMALRIFFRSRGHAIERTNLIGDLKRRIRRNVERNQMVTSY